jgi:hypothetical protein
MAERQDLPVPIAAKACRAASAATLLLAEAKALVA